jgi:hypothetical protein
MSSFELDNWKDHYINPVMFKNTLMRIQNIEISLLRDTILSIIDEKYKKIIFPEGNSSNYDTMTINNWIDILDTLLELGEDESFYDISVKQLVKLYMDTFSIIQERHPITFQNIIFPLLKAEYNNPLASPRRNIKVNLPKNVKLPSNAITYNEIKNGNKMVNFHNEYKSGRYYKERTMYNLYTKHNAKKQNPFTRQPIKPLNISKYRAHLVFEGGKTRRRVRKERKTRRYRKN